MIVKSSLSRASQGVEPSLRADLSVEKTHCHPHPAMLAQALTCVIFRPKKCVGPLTLELEDDSAPSESAGRFPESPADDCSLPAGPFASGVSVLAMICDREENVNKSRSMMNNGIRTVD